MTAETPTAAPGFTPGTLTLHTDPAQLSRVTSALRRTGRTVALVPTMGALHEGHLALVEVARRSGAVVVVSIFVNPAQFVAGEDLDTYPRTLEHDLELLRGAGVELVLAPTAHAMYPNGSRTSVQPGPLGTELEGAVRPHFFGGVLTVVAKLFAIVAPDAAYFGEKDYQQLIIVQQMVTDLNLPVKIYGVPIVREADGLALSSRNRYLDPTQRALATTLSAALTAGAHRGSAGPEAVLEAARTVLGVADGIEVDYLELRGTDLSPDPRFGAARLLVAARLGSTRLIDNVPVLLPEEK